MAGLLNFDPPEFGRNDMYCGKYREQDRKKERTTQTDPQEPDR